MTTLITDTGPHYSGSVICEGDDLWMTGYEMAATLGWHWDEDGMRLDDANVPVPADVIRDGRVNVAGLWRQLDWPLEHVPRVDTWVLCTGADVRRRVLERGRAPDFDLPDSAGRRHRLSDYRSRKVLLLTWASWCHSRDELENWQALHDELADSGLVVLALALDSDGPTGVRPCLEHAGVNFPCLVDVDHRTAALYNFDNTPQAVWIDEDGAIVRPTEPAGVTDTFRASRTAAAGADADTERHATAVRNTWMDAVRDWVAKGADSAFVMSPEDCARRVATNSTDSQRAQALFRLGRFLRAQNHWREAAQCFGEALRLHPDSWLLWRQVQELETPGGASGEAFDERLTALGERRFYAPIDMDGMP